jgi:hypothetical protein
MAAMKRLCLAVSSVAAGLLALVGSGQAQAPGSSVTAADRSTIASCLRDSGQAARTCIGAVAVVCVRQGTDRDEARVGCARREAAVWRERLDLALRALAQRLESGPRSRLASVQRSWETYAAQKCAFAGEMQPPAQALAMQTGCELRETALRAIAVERLIRRQAQGRSAPPLLER